MWGGKSQESLLCTWKVNLGHIVRREVWLTVQIPLHESNANKRSSGGAEEERRGASEKVGLKKDQFV